MDHEKKNRPSNSLSPPQSPTERIGKSDYSPSGQPSKDGRRYRFFNIKWLLLVLLTSVLLVVGGCSAILLQGQTIDLDKLGQIQNNSAIFDLKGNKVADLGDYQREVVKLTDIYKANPLLPEAFIKVEDVRFRQHSGVDFRGLMRAVVVNILKGGKAQGASTITMQVAGNVILESRKKTYTRKIKEIATAWNLEQNYSKEEILEAYLNYIYFGNNVRGIQMASKIYFGKDVTRDRLTIPEIAFLAGLPKAPEGYNPYASDQARERALKRRAVVLNELAETNEMKPLITQAEKEAALKAPLGTNEKWLAMYGKKGYQYESYKQFVLKELQQRYDIPASDVGTKGYRVITGINAKAQKKTDEILKDDSTYQGHDILDGGSATIDPKTGLLAAIGGGRHYEGQGYRINGLLPIQPGSSIKPLTVYAPAIEQSDGEINEYTIIPDEKITVDGYTPRNYDRIYRGNVPLSTVVKKSLNASTVWLLVNKVGIDQAYQTAQQLGLNLTPADKNIAPLALGGTTKGVTPLQLAQAYTALANNGVMTEAHAIKEVRAIEDGVETVIRPNKQPKQKQIFSPKTAYYMTRLLREVVESGTGTQAQLNSGQPVAGKTGTTQYNVAAWFTGYSPHYVTAAMVYNTSKTPQEDQIRNLTGGHYSTLVFREIMEAALKNKELQYFHRPAGVEDPVKPFQLEAPRVNGSFDPSTQAIHLAWQDQGPRVRYVIARSEDGQNFTTLAEIQANGYTDTNIDRPGLLDGLIGSTPSKTYFYIVTAIDNETNEQLPSGVISVTIQPEQQQQPSPEPSVGNQGNKPPPERPDSNQSPNQGILDGLQNQFRGE